MNIRAAALAIALLSTSASSVFASNQMILLNPDDLTQRAIINVDGDFNRLLIKQIGVAGELGNTARVSITGNGNGGPVGSRFSGGAAAVGLQAGSLTQQGFGNTIEVAVVGDDNLFAISQLGSNNTVQAAIKGFGNQAAVTQVGVGNFTSFSQSGIGNNISVQQTSW